MSRLCFLCLFALLSVTCGHLQLSAGSHDMVNIINMAKTTWTVRGVLQYLIMRIMTDAPVYRSLFLFSFHSSLSFLHRRVWISRTWRTGIWSLSVGRCWRAADCLIREWHDHMTHMRLKQQSFSRSFSTVDYKTVINAINLHANIVWLMFICIVQSVEKHLLHAWM